MELAYQQFMHADVKELTKESGCRKPCKYRKYRLIGDPQVLILEVYWAQWRVHLIQFSSPCLQPVNLPKSLLFRPFPTTHWFVWEGKRTLTYIDTYIPINSGGNWRTDLPLAVFSGWIWGSPWSFPWLLLYDYLGFSPYCLRIDCKCRQIKQSCTRELLVFGDFEMEFVILLLLVL